MRTLAGYEVLETLYEGGSSLVLRAVRDGKPVILKTLRAEYPTPRELARLTHEFEVTRELALPGVEHPLALDTSGPVPVLVLEDIGGVSLRQILNERRRLPVPLALRLGADIAEALAGVHRRQVIHKDIKPENIIVDLSRTAGEGAVRLTDFGLSSCLAQESSEAVSPDLLEGTLAYLAPEQTGRMNRSVDARSDLYSLGVTLYELLVGERPFEAADPMELLHGHLARTPAAPHERQPEIPRIVSEIVLKLLAKPAEDRYQSALGLKADLETCLAALETTGKPAAFPLGQRDLPSRLSLPQKLYGRERELAELFAALERCRGGATELLLVNGPPGSGKSALVRELQKPLGRERGLFASGRFEASQGQAPYSALLQAFRELLRRCLTESPEKLEGWRRRLLAALGPNGRVLAELVPELTAFIGEPPPVPELGPAETEIRFQTVLSAFVRVFARREHPLVLFIDDVQAADAGTLALATGLLRSRRGQALLVVGAYRDTPLPEDHPLTGFLRAVEESSLPVATISLGPLAAVPLTELLADMLRGGAARCEPLAALVLRKTGGNPFFVGQLLLALEARGLLVPDAALGAWRWDEAQLEGVSLTDNVAELLVERLRRLPEGTQRALAVAACLRSPFDLSAVAFVRGLSRAAAHEELWVAAREGLLAPIGDAYKSLEAGEPVSYHFLHERIEAAAANLLVGGELEEAHLLAGRFLAAHLTAEERDERLFEVLGHLNAGRTGISDPKERRQVAEWDRDAARRAKGGSAYDVALGLLEAGIELLGPDGFRAQPPLALELHLLRAECEFLTGRLEEAERHFDALVGRVAEPLERGRILSQKILLQTSRALHKEALETAAQAAREIGLRLSLDPKPLGLLMEYLKTRLMLLGRSPESLADLPETQDPVALAKLSLIESLAGPAYFYRRTLYGLLAFRAMQLSVRHGRGRFFPFALTAYGMILANKFGRYEAGHRHGEVGVRIAQQPEHRVALPRCQFVHGAFVNHWKRHARSSLELAQAAYQGCVDQGDLPFACFSTPVIASLKLFLGEPLPEILKTCEAYREFNLRYKNEDRAIRLQLVQEMCRALMGNPQSLYPSVGGSMTSADREELFSRAGSLTVQAWYRHCDLTLALLLGARGPLAALAARHEDGMKWIAPQAAAGDWTLHCALAEAVLAEEAPPSAREGALRRIRRLRGKLRRWASEAPANFLHKELMVTAELARLRGRGERAATAYDEAVRSASENGFVQHQALANELAARFHLSRGREAVARAYLAEARYGYTRWGAAAKVRELESRYPALLKTEAREGTGRTLTTSRTTTATYTVQGGSSGAVRGLDLGAVLKASQAISHELVLGTLLDRLMGILLEVAGAERGFLILRRDADLSVVASRQAGSAAILAEPVPLDASAELCAAIVRYAARTGEPVVLHEAAEDAVFSSDPYVQSRRPRSVLCAPIAQQGRLSGLVYLENNLTPGAFTADRLEVLRILSAEAAIAIENARLYTELSQTTERLRLTNEKFQAVAASVPILLYSFDLDGRITFAEGKGFQALGLSAGEVVGQSALDLWGDAPELYTACRTALGGEAAFAAAETRGAVLEAWCSPLRDAAGSVTGGIGVATDATARRKAQELRIARDAAEAASRTKSAFLASMSHELRTPLNAILGYSEMLEETAEEEGHDALVPDIRKIHGAGKHLLGLINDILDLSKIEAGRLELSPETFVVARVVEDACATVRPLMEKNRNRLLLEGVREVGAIHADPVRFRQVLLNLLSNAAKFTKDGCITVRIARADGASGERLQLSVSDTGIGMSEEQVGRLFQPFSQGDATISSRYGGTGLGLAISRRLCRLMGGEIAVSSEPGKGTTFRVDIPAGMAATV